MTEHVEMVCEGCEQRFVWEQPKVNIADYLRAAVADGWRDICEQENIPAVMDAVAAGYHQSLLVLFDGLCPACVARVRDLGRERQHLERHLGSFRR